MEFVDDDGGDGYDGDGDGDIVGSVVECFFLLDYY